MPKQRKQVDDDIRELVDHATEVAADVVIGRLHGMFENLRQTRLNPRTIASDAPSGALYTCAACRKQFTLDQLEMVHPSNGFATCTVCYAFMWEAAEQKFKYIAGKAAEAAKQRASAGQAGPRPQAPPGAVPHIKPWEVLGVSQDATSEEIKKAYRQRALKCHPDTLPESASYEQKEAAKARFVALTKAKDAMLSVRKAAE